MYIHSLIHTSLEEETEVKSKFVYGIQWLVAEQDQIPSGSTGTSSGIKRWKLACHTHDSLYKTILQDTLEGGRRRGGQRKC